MPNIVVRDPEDLGLGRIDAHGIGDDQDAAYPLRTPLTAPFLDLPLPRYKYWANFSTPPLAQGGTGTCVAHGGKNFMLTAPTIQTKRNGAPKPYDMYRQIVTDDEWSENDHEANGPDTALQFGTSVRALFRWLQRNGYLAEYRWVDSLRTLQQCASHLSPVVIGVNWYDGMFNPDSKGYLNLTGQVQGGHCVVIVGVNNVREDFTILNSWGKWGIAGKGRALVRFTDIERLLFAESGEGATGLELRIPPQGVHGKGRPSPSRA